MTRASRRRRRARLQHERQGDGDPLGYDIAAIDGRDFEAEDDAGLGRPAWQQTFGWKQSEDVLALADADAPGSAAPYVCDTSRPPSPTP